MNVLPEKWRKAFEALAENEAFEAAEWNKDGSWSAEVGCVITSGAQILRALPGDFELLAERAEEMFDQYGNGVDYELEAVVRACDAERAIFQYLDHWQAGLSGTVSVYRDDEEYRKGREGAVRDLKA